MARNYPTRPTKASDRKRSNSRRHETLRRREVRALKYRTLELDIDSLSRVG